MIIDIQYVKITLPTPDQMPKIVVLANIQDGTGRASLKFEDTLVHKAFELTPHHFQKMKDYCVKHGDFVFPDKTTTSHNYIYTEIISIFAPPFRFWSWMVWAIPYSKVNLKGK